MNPITMGISPCPNDTFSFYALLHGLVSDLDFTIQFEDLDTLNKLANAKSLDVIKVSFYQFATLFDDYFLLPCGSALGFDNGPKVISLKPVEDFSNCKIAFAGKMTTAHFLFDQFFTCKEKLFCPYFEIEEMVQKKQVDAGVIIHENRFTFEKKGLVENADLGKMWQQKTKMPLPLGGIAIKKSLEKSEMIQKALFDSIQFAIKNPEKTIEFVLKLSQEKNRDIVEKHIKTYVTKETEILSQKGIKAIDHFLSLACQHLNTPYNPDWLFSKSYV